jgi:hypothetical protein
MLPSKRIKALTVALLLAAPGLGAQARSDTARARPAPGLSLPEFEELRPALDVKNQPWATIPWKYSITEARKQAAQQKKPIFMVVNSGNVLGCV